MTRLAARTERIDSSGIRKVFDLAARMKDPINLSIGQPDFDVPEELKAAAHRAIDAGFNRYTVTGGNQAFRDRIRELHADKRGIENDDVMITSGVSGGLLLAFAALFNEGDEVIVPDPYFVMYKHLLNLLGAKPVFVDTYPDFQVHADRLAAAITDRTRGILLNTPSNPTGAVLSGENMRAIAKLVAGRDIILISDEIYDLFCYDEDFASPATIADKVLLLKGFSKNCAMTGWRLGYAVGPADILHAMLELQQYTFVCAPSVAQVMGLAALELDLTPYRDQYRRKRDMIYEGLKDCYNLVKPGGAFYAFPEAPGGDGDAFVPRCIENSLLCVPGSVFSERRSHFRLSYAASEETLKRGIEVLRKLAG